MRIFEINDDFDNRVFSDYLKRMKIGLNDMVRMSPEEIARLRSEAMSDVKQYPIPRSENGYLYHGTKSTNISSIMKTGLVPSSNSRWQRNSFIGDHAIGKIFFTTSVPKAEFYATNTKPAILRVRSEYVVDPKDDFKETNSVYTTTTVPPNHIEIWKNRKWKKLISD